VTIKFGESAWLAPESARALGVLLCELADRLAEDLGESLPVVDVAAVKAAHGREAAPVPNLAANLKASLERAAQ
jgi:hypothetical protein